MSTTALEEARIVTVTQIIDGDATCAYCDKGAVLRVDSEPDNDPGLVCFEHYNEWMGMTTKLIERLFGPKEA
jgi:hypothetical protein